MLIHCHCAGTVPIADSYKQPVNPCRQNGAGNEALNCGFLTNGSILFQWLMSKLQSLAKKHKWVWHYLSQNLKKQVKHKPARNPGMTRSWAVRFHVFMATAFHTNHSRITHSFVNCNLFPWSASFSSLIHIHTSTKELHTLKVHPDVRWPIIYWGINDWEMSDRCT